MENIKVTDSISVVIEQKIMYECTVLLNGKEEKDAQSLACSNQKIAIICALEYLLSETREKLSNADIEDVLSALKNFGWIPFELLNLDDIASTLNS